jgi:uncharacterized ferredoxin-like protein
MDSATKKEIGKATLAALRARPRQKKVTAPSGLEYVIRRLETAEILSLQQGIPDIAGQPITDEEAASVARRMVGMSPVDGFRRAQRFVAAALVAPEVGEGEDQIQIEEVPIEDLTALINEVNELSGIGRKAAMALRPTSGADGSLLH